MGRIGRGMGATQHWHVTLYQRHGGSGKCLGLNKHYENDLHLEYGIERSVARIGEKASRLKQMYLKSARPRVKNKSSSIFVSNDNRSICMAFNTYLKCISFLMRFSCSLEQNSLSYHVHEALGLMGSMEKRLRAKKLRYSAIKIAFHPLRHCFNPDFKDVKIYSQI